mmetsp:Transcript_30183/g.78231  ORF Transcript_30183/g.78231 Transcript_30183/m.78231 type:complete len:246 (-) Transcript_30183:494-1231(-)
MVVVSGLALMSRLKLHELKLVPQLSLRQRHLGARAVLFALELIRVLRLLHLAGISRKLALGALRHRLLVHGLQCLARLVPTVDHLEEFKPTRRRSAFEDGEGVDVREEGRALHQGLVCVRRAKRHDIGACCRDEVADRVVGHVEHGLNVFELIEEHQVDCHLSVVARPDATDAHVHLIGLRAKHFEVQRVWHLLVPRRARLRPLAIRGAAVPAKRMNPLVCSRDEDRRPSDDATMHISRRTDLLR